MEDFNRYGRKDYPFRNTMDLTANEYHQFIMQFQTWLNQLKTQLNMVLSMGIVWPFNYPEFDQRVEYVEGAIYFIFDNLKTTPSS